jgi:hypothetical protein
VIKSMLILLFTLHSSLPCQEVIVWPSVMFRQCVHSPFCMRVYEKGLEGTGCDKWHDTYRSWTRSTQAFVFGPTKS